MKDLSLNVLDVTENSISAGASLIELTLSTEGGILTISIKDNGCGIPPEMLKTVTDPFTTSRTTRRVGMGLPLFKLAAAQTGGSLTVQSTVGVGTEVTAVFDTSHIDCPPLGDMASTVSMLIAGLRPGSEIVFTERTEKGSLVVDTRELREALGADISLAEPEVQDWISGFIREQETGIR